MHGDISGNEQIEIRYKFKQPTLKEIFENLCAELKTKELPTKWEKHGKKWTNLIKDKFAEIGRAFGYKIRKSGKGGEWMSFDVTWAIRLPDYSAIVMALEVENTSDIHDLLDDELQKLLDVKAYTKILIYYPLEPENDLEEIRDKIRSQKIKLPDEKILVITGTYDEDIDPKHIVFRAYEFDADGKSTLIGRNKVDYTEK